MNSLKRLIVSTEDEDDREIDLTSSDEEEIMIDEFYGFERILETTQKYLELCIQMFSRITVRL